MIFERNLPDLGGNIAPRAGSFASRSTAAAKLEPIEWAKASGKLAPTDWQRAKLSITTRRKRAKAR